MTDARTRLERADHGVLSTLHPTRGIDSVPVCFVVAGDIVGIPIDTVKPKRSTQLGRLRNLEADPRDASRRALGRRRLERARGGCACRSADRGRRPTLPISSRCSPRSTRSTRRAASSRSSPCGIIELSSWDAAPRVHRSRRCAAGADCLPKARAHEASPRPHPPRGRSEHASCSPRAATTATPCRATSSSCAPTWLRWTRRCKASPVRTSTSSRRRSRR